MIKEMDTIKETVEQLLQKHEILRDNDTLLLLSVIDQKCNLKSRIGKEAFYRMAHILMSEAPKFETVRRTRQKIQEEGRFIGNSRQARMRKAEEVKKGIGKL